VITAAAIALALGLFVTTRAARAFANVSEMRSDFVSTVTHELKTPVQVIRSIGETLARGRVENGERLQEYAHLLVQEGHRLSRLIDNLLAYSRVTDVAQVYSFEPHHPTEIVTEALRGFTRLIKDRDFELTVDVPETLPLVRADRTSIVLALDNLIDNGMRYSGDSRKMEITARAVNGGVEITVRDCGVGIDVDELERVKGRFARGRSAQGHGSGLGLAIVNRIVNDHGGSLRLESVKNAGTSAIVALPLSSQ
jgi:signal transduction histidine kinase